MAQAPRGTSWTPFTMLEDLDFADNTALLSHKYKHITIAFSEILGNHRSRQVACRAVEGDRAHVGETRSAMKVNLLTFNFSFFLLLIVSIFYFSSDSSYLC